MPETRRRMPLTARLVVGYYGRLTDERGTVLVAAAEFDRMLERLDDSFKRLSQFTADAAHEFRTPLNRRGHPPRR